MIFIVISVLQALLTDIDNFHKHRGEKKKKNLMGEIQSF